MASEASPSVETTSVTDAKEQEPKKDLIFPDASFDENGKLILLGKVPAGCLPDVEVKDEEGNVTGGTFSESQLNYYQWMIKSLNVRPDQALIRSIKRKDFEMISQCMLSSITSLPQSVSDFFSNGIVRELDLQLQNMGQNCARIEDDRCRFYESLVLKKARSSLYNDGKYLSIGQLLEWAALGLSAESKGLFALLHYATTCRIVLRNLLYKHKLPEDRAKNIPWSFLHIARDKDIKSETRLGLMQSAAFMTKDGGDMMGKISTVAAYDVATYPGKVRNETADAIFQSWPLSLDEVFKKLKAQKYENDEELATEFRKAVTEASHDDSVLPYCVWIMWIPIDSKENAVFLQEISNNLHIYSKEAPSGTFIYVSDLHLFLSLQRLWDVIQNVTSFGKS